MNDLAAAVGHRRIELNMTLQDVQDAGGPSSNTTSRLERGYLSALNKKSLNGFDDALAWPSGTAARIYAQGGPGSDVTGLRAVPGGGTVNDTAEARRVALKLAVDTVSHGNIDTSRTPSTIADYVTALADSYLRWVDTGSTYQRRTS